MSSNERKGELKTAHHGLDPSTSSTSLPSSSSSSSSSSSVLLSSLSLSSSSSSISINSSASLTPNAVQALTATTPATAPAPAPTATPTSSHPQSQLQSQYQYQNHSQSQPHLQSQLQPQQSQFQSQPASLRTKRNSASVVSSSTSVPSSRRVFTFSESDFESLLIDEITINIDRLREAASHGLPSAIRGEVWKMLLGVNQTDRNETINQRNKQTKEFEGLEKEAERLGAEKIKRKTEETGEGELSGEDEKGVVDGKGNSSSSGGSSSSQSSATFTSLSASSASFTSALSSSLLELHSCLSHLLFVRRSSPVTVQLLDSQGDQIEHLLSIYLCNHQKMKYNISDLLYILLPFVWSLLVTPNNTQHQDIHQSTSSPTCATLELSISPVTPPSSSSPDSSLTSSTSSPLIDCYYCFDSMLIRISAYRDRLNVNLSQFLFLFRWFQSELCSYIEDEEVECNMWISEWLRTLLSSALPIDQVCRLWDTYLSGNNTTSSGSNSSSNNNSTSGNDKGGGGFDLHIYVCLALCMIHTEEMMELEHSELLAFLHALPTCNMDQVIMQAYNIREDAKTQKLV